MPALVVSYSPLELHNKEQIFGVKKKLMPFCFKITTNKARRCNKSPQQLLALDCSSNIHVKKRKFVNTKPCGHQVKGVGFEVIYEPSIF